MQLFKLFYEIHEMRIFNFVNLFELFSTGKWISLEMQNYFGVFIKYVVNIFEL